MEIEPEAEQDALLEHAGGDPGMADGPEEDRVHVPKLADGAVGEDFAGTQIVLAADVDGLERVFEALGSRDRGEDFQALGDDLRPDPISRHDPDLDQVRPLASSPDRSIAATRQFRRHLRRARAV